MTMPTIGFVGMSHLGILSSVAAAEKGFKVVGYDPSPEVASLLSQGRLPITEPDLPETLQRNMSRLRFTSVPGDLAQCDVVVLSRDVPTDHNGQSDLTPVEALFSQMVASSKPEAVLVILCQVPPGFTRAHAQPKRNLYYQVETLIFGQAVERALKPERYIVGCAEPKHPLPAAYDTYLRAFDCPIMPMSYESAELTKIAVNCCLVSMVSTANTLAELCESIGADWSEIVPALRSDRRIGPYSYLTPGLGIAGGNLERDLATVVKIAEAHHTSAKVVSAWIDNSNYRKNWPVSVLKREFGDKVGGKKIGVLGLAYKIDTASIKNSPALHLVNQLPSANFQAHDPAVDSSALPGICRCATPIEACQDADALAVMTPWKMYKELNLMEIGAAMRGRLLVDPFSVFETEAVLDAGFRHVTLGKRLAG